MISNLSHFYTKVKLYPLLKIVSSYLVQVANLATALILGPKEYGLLALLISFAQFIFVMSAGISNGALINIGTKRYIKTGQYHDVVVYRYVFAFLALFPILLGYIFFEEKIVSTLDVPDALKNVFLLASAYFFYEMASQLLLPGGSFKKQIYIEFLLALAFAVLLLAFARTYEIYIHLYVLVSAIGSICVLFIYVKDGNWMKGQFEFLVFKEVSVFSLWQIVGVLSIYVLNFGYNYLLLLFDIPMSEIGVLNFSLKLFLGMSGVFSLVLILMPRVIHSEKFDFVRRKLNIYIIWSVLVLCVLYLFACLCAYGVISYLGRNEYLESVKYMFWMTPAFGLMAYSNIFNTAFSNTRLFKIAQFVIVLQSILVIVFCLITIPFFGVKSLFMSYGFSYLSGAVITYLIYVKNRDAFGEGFQ